MIQYIYIYMERRAPGTGHGTDTPEGHLDRVPGNGWGAEAGPPRATLFRPGAGYGAPGMGAGALRMAGHVAFCASEAPAAAAVHEPYMDLEEEEEEEEACNLYLTISIGSADLFTGRGRWVWLVARALGAGRTVHIHRPWPRKQSDRAAGCGAGGAGCRAGGASRGCSGPWGRSDYPYLPALAGKARPWGKFAGGAKLSTTIKPIV